MLGETQWKVGDVWIDNRWSTIISFGIVTKVEGVKEILLCGPEFEFHRYSKHFHTYRHEGSVLAAEVSHISAQELWDTVGLKLEEHAPTGS